MAHSKKNTRAEPASTRYRSGDQRKKNKMRKILKSNGPYGQRELDKWLAYNK